MLTQKPDATASTRRSNDAGWAERMLSAAARAGRALNEWDTKVGRDMAARMPAGTQLKMGSVPDWIGGPKIAFHGSPSGALKAISANATERNMDNAASTLGAFLSPSRAEAARYAGSGGRVYEVPFSLNNPHEMSINELDRLMDFSRGADGKTLPFGADAWNARKAELTQEAAALRDQLLQRGHDGIVVRGRGMRPDEYISFSDVKLP